ncbi:MAG: hypothetical protein JXA52_04615 [Planctomycetes bacterium]|nr:hypothetical protein [Planctomycetota bacterium]
MSLIINHNIAAMNTQRNLEKSNSMLAKSLQKLSSGYKINVAADDPSGLIISEQLRSQTHGLQRAIQNSQEASNVLGIAEGALIEINEILRTLRALALHAANSGVTAPDQIRADQAEVDSAIQTINRIADTTKYSDQYLLNGSKGIVYERTTTIDDTTDFPLLDTQATRVDQIFKREDFSISVSYSGAKSATQADYTKEARRAYLEADNANAEADISGNALSERQEFIVTGTKGSRLFTFAKNVHLGDVVDSINNLKESTGVSAALAFASDTTPDVTDGAVTALTINGTRAAGDIQVYGADLNVAPKISEAGIGAADDFRVGLNCDGHGRVYGKVLDDTVGTEVIAWYRDKDCTLLIGTQSGAGAGNFAAANGSGITDLYATVTGVAAVDDIYTLAVVGQEMNTALNFDANVQGISGWSGMSAASLNVSVISGVELGTNTSSTGQLYFKASGLNASRLIEVFSDEEMAPDSLVASGTADLSLPATDQQIRIEARQYDDGTDSNLNLTLMFDDAASSNTETGFIAFNNLGMRLYSEDYGSQAYVRVQNREGTLWNTFSAPDNTTTEMLEEGNTVQVLGSDAEISINGAPLFTQGLEASATTPDFSGLLVFEEGELGAATIAQVGYATGSVYSRMTALQTADDSVLPSLTNVFTYATNARHTTTDVLDEFIGGMQYQLGEGSGDQLRTVYGLPSMSAVNIGRVVIDDVTYQLQNVLGGSTASLATDPITALKVISKAIDDVSSLRARLGAFQKNMLQTNINSLNVTVENITMTESAIRDANMAAETTEYTKAQILTQAGTAMLAQANTVSQNVLQLLG